MRLPIATVTSLACLALAAWCTPSLSYDAATLIAAQRELQRGVNQGDPRLVLQARARLQSLASVEPKAALLHYWIAVADWRAVPLLLNGKQPNRQQAERHAEAGLAAADRAFELDPKSGGALALKAGLLGLSLSFKAPSAAMSVGPEMEGLLGRAAGVAPDDPRVPLLDGINTLHKPAFVGGGPQPALAKFVKAIELFDAAAPADSAAPSWGRDDALLWAGRAEMQLHEYESARSYFRRALEANPDNGWVRVTLLPEAEKALAEGLGEEKK